MISVCMATYNGSRYIRQQVDSIMSQLGAEDELVVSDDGSTDDTLDIIRNINDSRIRIIPHSPRPGKWDPVQRVTHNFENALREAKGDYIFLSDQDDVWLPRKVEIMMRWLKDYDYVQSDCIITDSDLNMCEHLKVKIPQARNRWTALVGAAPYMGCVSAFSRRLLDRALPFPKNLQSHDRWLGFLASIRYSYVLIPDQLIYYRKHDANVSSTFGKSRNSMAYRVRTRLYYISALIRRTIFGK